MSTETAPLPIYDDPTIVHQNRLPYHAHAVPYPTLEAAQQNDWRTSPRISLLNGEWMFLMAAEKDRIPAGFEQTEFNDDSWHKLPVPSNWQRHGFGLPLYVNTSPAQDPDEVGCYRRWIDLDQSAIAGRTIIHFAGVRTAFTLHVNGTSIGYSETGYLPTEFDITEHIKSGRNLLAVTVYRRSKSLHLENFDHWRLSGIFRDVYLVYKPNLHIADFATKTDLINDYKDGDYGCTVTVCNHGKTASQKAVVKVHLLQIQPEQKPVLSLTQTVKSLEPGEKIVVDFSQIIPDVAVWSAELPGLYQTVIVLNDELEQVLESVSCTTGFRHIEIRDKQYLLNGQPIMIKGVNRHEWHPELGQAITDDITMQDILLMKRHNINAIRTSHYANSPWLLDMCDKYGIYLMDEAAHETHWNGDWEQRPDWLDLHMFRIQGLMERDKNHPCVVFWSIGNEFHDGPNTRAMYEWARMRDPSRPVFSDAGERGGPTQINGFGYFGLDNLEQLGEDTEHPLISKEYAHTMGNALGQLDDMWEIIYYPGFKSLQGGFIWEWLDHGWQVGTGENGWFDYGVRTGKTLDGHFNIDGILPPDRSVSPKLLHIKHVYQDIEVRECFYNEKRVTISNRSYFQDTSWLTCTWRVEVNGKIVEEGELPDLIIAPQNSLDVVVPCSEPRLIKGDKCYVSFLFTTKRDLLWAPRGHCVAYVQEYPMCWRNSGADTKGVVTANTPIEPGPAPAVTETPESVVVTGQDFSLTLCKKDGSISSWKIGATEMIHEGNGPRLSLWRPTIDNDDQGWGNTNKTYADTWRSTGLANLRQVAAILEWKSYDDFVAVTIGCGLYHVDHCVCQVEYVYIIPCDGNISIEVDYKPGEHLSAIRSLPRIGVAMAINKCFDNVRWFGRGGHENYCDRCVDAPMGLYSMRVTEQKNPYIFPQAYGNRTDVHWVTFADAAGFGISARMETEFKCIRDPYEWMEFSALPYSDATIEKAVLASELVPDNAVWVHLDYMQAGVGNMPKHRPLEDETEPRAVKFIVYFDPIHSSDQ